MLQQKYIAIYAVKTINEGLKKNKIPSQQSKRYKQENRTTSTTLEPKN